MEKTTCSACQSLLPPGANFCPNCAAPAAQGMVSAPRPSSTRTIVAGFLLLVVIVSAVVYLLIGSRGTTSKEEPAVSPSHATEAVSARKEPPGNDAILPDYEKFVGAYPLESKFLEVPALRRRIDQLLSSNPGASPAFYDRFVVEGPIRKVDSIIYAHGCQAHLCGSDTALLLIDTRANCLRIVIGINREFSDFADPGCSIDVPKDVEMYAPMGNARRLPPSPTTNDDLVSQYIEAGKELQVYCDQYDALKYQFHNGPFSQRENVAREMVDFLQRNHITERTGRFSSLFGKVSEKEPMQALDLARENGFWEAFQGTCWQ